MGRLSMKHKNTLRRIELERFKVAYQLKENRVTEEEIIDIIQNYNYNFLLGPENKKNKKETLIRRIFNLPFLLCDQKNLSVGMKEKLPLLLGGRYIIEVNELEYQLEEGYISIEEYEDNIKDLYFCYYESSKDGRNIAKTGKAIGIKGEPLRLKIDGKPLNLGVKKNILKLK